MRKHEKTVAKVRHTSIATEHPLDDLGDDEGGWKSTRANKLFDLVPLQNRIGLKHRAVQKQNLQVRSFDPHEERQVQKTPT